MSPVTKFILAMVRGMGGPDIEKWIEETPSALGEEAGRLIREVANQYRNPSTEPERRLAEYLEHHQDEALDVFGSLLTSLGSASTSSDSSLMKYLQILNFVVSVLEATKGSIVLRGFLHTDSSLSYWHFEGASTYVEFREFRKHPDLDLIMAPQGVKVYILDGAANTERLKELNLAIRKRRDRNLEWSMYKEFPCVASIEEFTLKLKVGLVEEVEADIPIGAPGLVELIKSVPVALQMHQLPGVELEKTMRQIQEIATPQGKAT